MAALHCLHMCAAFCRVGPVHDCFTLPKLSVEQRMWGDKGRQHHAVLSLDTSLGVYHKSARHFFAAVGSLSCLPVPGGPAGPANTQANAQAHRHTSTDPEQSGMRMQTHACSCACSCGRCRFQCRRY
jgi:hypothetical protein